MKKTLFSALAALALCLIALPATAEEDVYTLLDENGTALTQYLGECEAGDEYISGDNLHYRVISVDPQAKTAQLELLGDADMPDVSWLEMEQSLAVSATNNRKIALYCTHSDESYIEGDGTESDEERGGIYDVAAVETWLEDLARKGENPVCFTGSRVDLLENRVTLCVPEGNPAGIESYDDMAQALKDGAILLAMGNSDVPVGQYTQKILAYYDLDETALAGAGAITYCTNVKEVTTQVSEGSVDCGVIYCTDAFSAGLTPVAYATAEMCGQIIYPAAVLSVSQHPTEAQAFLDYLSTPEAMAVFEAVGFAAA